MKNLKPIIGMVVGGLVLLASPGGVVAQEAPPPPPRGGYSVQSFRFEYNGKPVTGAPYSAVATTETDQTLSDGNQIHRQNTTNLYRDSQGRTRREETLGEVGPWSSSQTTPEHIVFINDPVAGVNYIMHPEELVAEKMPRADLGREAMMKEMKVKAIGAQGGASASGNQFYSFSMAPPPGGGETVTINKEGLVKEGLLPGGNGEAGATESLGTQTMEGVQATGTRHTFTIPAGKIGNELPIQIVTERWYSPALQTVVMSKQSDPRIGVTTYQLTNINLAEPSPDLFQVPPDYTIRDGGKAGIHVRQELKPPANP